MTGFKSFADKTKLEFEPGMTAIVGPNGCGKSNIADAVRWVLGEQSAKVLRGAKMEDFIFNGTDARKSLGMAEVSITLGDCEDLRDTEYNEISVTRRVFRSGEGQYFINKTPCRLKDIQRLFMDTGIGTTSYSLMEQGHIDRVLSSRPEDRRVIIDEASGITKFKADKKEAIRKLEYTEANLLRLADVIREVKRQIGSLQRQAGKARRYKSLKEELRKLDIFATRKRLNTADTDIHNIETEISALNSKLRAAQSEVEKLEEENAVLRKSLMQTEREIGAILEAGIHAQSKLDHARELIRVNHQRIEEYRGWSERDSGEIDLARQQMKEKRRVAQELAGRTDKARSEQKEAEQRLKANNESFGKLQQQRDATRVRIQESREESVELESLISKLQNQLVEIESSERSTVIRKERLSAEKGQLARAAAACEKRQTDMSRSLENLREEAAPLEDALKQLKDTETAKSDKIRELEQRRWDLKAQAAAKNAQIELLHDNDVPNAGLPYGSRLLIDEANPLDIDQNKIIGDLLSHLDVEPEYRTALKAALRSRLDAVLVKDSASALDMLARLETRKAGSARLLSVEPPGETHQNSLAGNTMPTTLPAEERCTKLIDHVKYTNIVIPLVQRLIGNTVVIDSLEDVPSPTPFNGSYVTRNGSLVCGDGWMEFWTADAPASDPLSRKHLLAETESSLANIETQIEEHDTAIADLIDRTRDLETSIRDSQSNLDRSRRAMAQKEGEYQIISSEAAESRERLDTVTWELKNLDVAETNGPMDRQTIRDKTEKLRHTREQTTSEFNTQNEQLRELEIKHSDLQAKVTEHRMRFAELSQKVEHLESQHAAVNARVKELETTINGRLTGMLSYQTGITKLTEAIKTAETQITSLEDDVNTSSAKADNLQKNKEKQSEELQEMESVLSQKRSSLEGLRDNRSALEIRYAESKMQRQNHIDRITSEYRITVEQIMKEAEPEWKDEISGMDALETSITELRTKIEAMGAVNLVAIEEHKELQERYTFLTQQEEDLVKAKQQLLDMIKKINTTTSEMFSETFAAANENFQTMFKKLFDGGSAKLVLVNEEDVLESGIEIIARPPGKRLQNISLLSGGERTLTAVALLFSIYMIKPSPFCLLDELDAALDDANIGRFVNVLQSFLGHSQFIVITHNRQTISASTILYGITMPEEGISKIVSMKFRDHKKGPVPAEAATT